MKLSILTAVFTLIFCGAAAINKAVTNNVKAAVYLLSVTADPYRLAR
ncbi:MAG TPA: hypothetical protein PKI19_10365 [Elusimicrobiales bacterium]|nr:hypothetical protein [Elusimicrobiales bacterium]